MFRLMIWWELTERRNGALAQPAECVNYLKLPLDSPVASNKRSPLC
jgi:hypothetical protein